MDKAKEEQWMIDQYHENIRQNENAMDDLLRQEKKLEKKEQEMYDFKNAFRSYISTEYLYDGCPSEFLQIDDIKKYFIELDDFEAELGADIHSTESCYEEEYERLQKEKKKLWEQEEMYTEELHKSLRNLDKNQETR